jgi:hypothetical protein
MKVLANLEDEQWYKHVPKSVETSREYKVTVLWNQQVTTDRIRYDNKPDIMYRGSDMRTFQFMDN